MPRRRPTAASLIVRMARPPERAEQGALPKSFILASAGRRVAPGFLIVSPSPGKRVSTESPVPLGFCDPGKGQGRGKPFPQIPHICVWPAGSQTDYAIVRGRLRARDGEGRSPQKPHSWRIFRPEAPRGPVSRLLSHPASEQGGRARLPKSFIVASVRKALRQRPHRSPNSSYFGSICFRILSQVHALLPKSLIIAPQISHFIPRILHSYPESFPKSLIGFPKSFIIN